MKVIERLRTATKELRSIRRQIDAIANGIDNLVDEVEE